MSDLPNSKEIIGIFGGTFDPVHKGHIHLAQTVFNSLHFDRFIFMPTGGSYLKTGVTPSTVRYEMTKIAAEAAGFEVTDIESSNEGPSYTYKSLEQLHEMYPDSLLYFIMGEDSIRYIEKWKEPQIIFSIAHIVVARRIGHTYIADDNRSLQEIISYLKNKYNASIDVIEFDDAISSTEIRKLFIDGKTEEAKTLLTDEVYDYIQEKGLYQ